MISFVRKLVPYAALAALASMTTACDAGPSVAPVAFPSLDSTTQAKYAALIASAFPRNGRVNVRYDEAKLDQHPRDAAVLTRLGYVERVNGAYRFTPAGRRASTGKCDYSPVPCADFTVGRNEFVSTESIRFRTVLGIVHAVLAKVKIRTIPTTPLGKALAGSSDLACESGPSFEPWRGESSIADGVIIMSINDALPSATLDAAADFVAPKTIQNGPVGPYLTSTCPSYPGEYVSVYSNYTS